MGSSEMLGLYENFPKNVHRITRFTTSISGKKTQETLIQALYRTENDTFNLEDIADPSLHQCTIVFEFGIADADSFTYLDEEETHKLIETVRKAAFKILDALCVICYYRIQDGKKTPLKFDHYILRFTFEPKTTALQVFHEKGPMNMSPEELTSFIAERVNLSFSKKVLRA